MIQNYPNKGSGTGLKKWLKMAMNLSLVAIILMASAATTYAQSRTVTGKVTDANGEGLIGVNVLIKGTLNGVATDIDGSYSISASDTDILVFSYIGFSTQEITVGAQAVIDILMEEDYGNLDEVVVIGYGTTKKSDLTGSVTAIDTKDFNQGQINTPQQLLTGRIAGLSVTPGNGEPGGGATIRIRGGSSLSASNDPLFVIDGVPISLENIGGIRNPLSTINPADIESVTVLKDASATAIYGARASNGVIIVTTKRGSANQPLTVGYNAQFSLSTLPAQLDVLNGDQYRAFVQQNFPEQANQVGSANTNWQDQIFEDAFGTNHNISASGNIKGVPFRASIGYLDQEGTLRTGGFQRTTVSIGLDPTLLNDNLKINLNVKGSFNNSDFANTDAIGASLDFDPTQPVRTDGPWGNYFFYPGNNADFPFAASDVAPENPVALLEQTTNSADVNRLIANVNLNYSLPFVEGLSANLNLATDRTTTDGLDVSDSLAAYEFEVREGQALFGKRNKYDNRYENNLLEFYLNYQKYVRSIDTDIQITGGYSFQEFFRENESELVKFGDGSIVEINPFNSDPSENRLISYYGRLQLNTAEKYLLTATLRRDGSSRFLGDNQWGLFPSVAFAWRVKDESFLADVEFVSDLKFRAGYGVTAQENVGPAYPALARINISQDNALYQIGTSATGEPIFVNLARFEAFDPNLKWEETSTLNFGIDYGFWDGRISGSIDYYQRETTDLLNTIPISAGINFSDQLLTNVGSLENTGVEFAINGILVDNSDWRIDLGYNLTINRNEITKLTRVDDPTFPGNETGGISGGIGNNAQLNTVGFQRRTFWLYEQVYDDDGRPIEGLYVDINGDNHITDADRVRESNPDPQAFMGFSGNFAYRNLSLGFNARMLLDNFVYNNNDANYGVTSLALGANQTLRNRVTDVLRTGFQNPQLLSNYYLQNASFFRMDNITIGYRVPQFFSENVEANLSFTIQNAFVITDYTGLDPEIENGIDNNLVPRPRVFTLGVDLRFKK